MEFTFETVVDDVKTSVVKKDTCQLSGELTVDGTDIKVGVTFTADDADVFDKMFDGVGRIVTFAVVENAQKALGSYGADGVYGADEVEEVYPS